MSDPCCDTGHRALWRQWLGCSVPCPSCSTRLLLECRREMPSWSVRCRCCYSHVRAAMDLSMRGMFPLPHHTQHSAQVSGHAQQRLRPIMTMRLAALPPLQRLIASRRYLPLRTLSTASRCCLRTIPREYYRSATSSLATQARRTFLPSLLPPTCRALSPSKSSLSCLASKRRLPIRAVPG